MKRLCDPLLAYYCSVLALLFDCLIASRSSPRCFPGFTAPGIPTGVLPLALAHFGWWAFQVCLPSWWASAQGLRSREKVERVSSPGGDYRRRRADLPVAVLAIAVPVMGFGQQPAIIALIRMGVAHPAGDPRRVGRVPASVMSVASGMGNEPSPTVVSG